MKRHSIVACAVPLLATLWLAACAVGTPFVRPAPEAIEMGKTTYAQVVERLGKPSDETRSRKDGHVLRAIDYTHASDAEAAKVPNPAGIRQLIFVFSDDVVVAESFVSSFASDSTDFDDRRVGEIVKGKTRCDEVLAMFGRPSARAIYPVADQPGETAIGYEFKYVKRPILQFKIFAKSLLVTCDAAGTVTQSTYSESGDR